MIAHYEVFLIIILKDFTIVSPEMEMEGRYYQWRLKTCRKNLKNFKLKNSGDYHDLYLQKYILLLADIFKNFPNKFSVTYELDSTDFLSAPGLPLQRV